MARYDLVSNINKILEVTGQENLIIIGHSQGNAQAFAALSDPEIAPKIESKVKLLVALSAPLYLSNVHSKFWSTCAKWDCQQIFIDISVYGIFDGFERITPIIAPICNIIEPICWQFDKIIADEDPHVENWDRMDEILAHEPGATSSFNFAHWGQLIKTGKFIKYDYGSKSQNQAAYGQDDPPEYDIKQVKVPIALFVGGDDAIVSIEGSRLVRDTLLQVQPSQLMFYKEIANYGHLSFLWANDIYEQLLPDLINVLKTLGNQNNNIIEEKVSKFLEIFKRQ